MAEGIFRELIKNDREFDGLMCQSAGLSANNGELASVNSVTAMKEIGIDISEHRARKITPEEIPMWDAFFTMSKTHAYILERGGVPTDKIYVPSYIDDPFGGDLQEYRNCRDKIHEEVSSFYNRLKDVITARIRNNESRSSPENTY